MKKTLFTIIFLFQVIFAIGQETKPSGLKLIQSPSFHYNPVDSAVWMYKNSTYLWNRVNYQHWSLKTDANINPVRVTSRDQLNVTNSATIGWTSANLTDSTKSLNAIVDTSATVILSRQRAANTYQLKLGYTPYNATNPAGYTTNVGTVTSITAGLGLSGGAITTAGTVALDTASTVVLSRQRAANTYQAKTYIIDNSTQTNTGSSQTGSTSSQTATTKTYTPKGSKALILFSCRLFNSTGTAANVYFKTSVNGGTPATIMAHEYISNTQISVKGYDLVNVNQNSSNTIDIVWTSDTNHSISERSLIIIDLP